LGELPQRDARRPEATATPPLEVGLALPIEITRSILVQDMRPFG